MQSPALLVLLSLGAAHAPLPVVPSTHTLLCARAWLSIPVTSHSCVTCAQMIRELGLDACADTMVPSSPYLALSLPRHSVPVPFEPSACPIRTN